MTCIVGWEQDGVVWLGGDSCGSDGSTNIIRDDVKVFKRRNVLIGYTSSFRMGQILRYSFNPPPHKKGISAHEYLATAFVDSLRKCFKDKGFAKKKEEVESSGTFLVGYKGKLYFIESDYQIGISRDTYFACGYGGVAALGALCILSKKAKINPEIILLESLRASAHINPFVLAPFRIINSKGFEEIWQS